jgi:hypothetical protein
MLVVLGLLEVSGTWPAVIGQLRVHWPGSYARLRVAWQEKTQITCCCGLEGTLVASCH